MFRKAIFLVFALVAASYPLLAQQTGDTVLFSPNRLSFGLGLRSPNFAPMLSVGYGRTLEKGNVELEFLLQTTSFSALQEDRLSSPIPGIQQYVIGFNNSVSIDASALFTLFSAVPRLKVGGGLTLERAEVGSGSVFLTPTGGNATDSLTVRPNPFLGRTTFWLYGLNGKIDYSVPLSNSFELGGRLQGYALINVPFPGQVLYGGYFTAGVYCNARF